MISAQSTATTGATPGLGPASTKSGKGAGAEDREAFGRTLDDSMSASRAPESAESSRGADKSEAAQKGSEPEKAANGAVSKEQDGATETASRETGDQSPGTLEEVTAEESAMGVHTDDPELELDSAGHGSVSAESDGAAASGTAAQAVKVAKPAETVAMAADDTLAETTKPTAAGVLPGVVESAASATQPNQASGNPVEGGKPLPAVAAVIAALQSGQARPVAGGVPAAPKAETLAQAGRSLLHGGASADGESDNNLREMLGRMANGGDSAGIGKSGAERGATAIPEPFRHLLTRTTSEPTTVSTPTPNSAPMASAAPPVGTLAPGVALSIAVPVKQSGWDQAVGDRVIWMTRQGVQEAQIQLNPRNLGPIDVKVSVQNDQASVTFTVQNGATREALEAAMPRLRDMFGEQGLQLAQSDVQHRDGTPGGKDSGDQGGGSTGEQLIDGETEMVEAGVTTLGPAGNGLVDYFA